MKSLFFGILLLLGSFSVQAQSSPEQIIDKFFQDLVTEKPEKALDNLYTHLPWLANIKGDVDKLKTQFITLQTYFGKYCGNAMIAKKDIANTFIIYSYLVKYERQPVRFTFKFYKPKDSYIVFSFSYDMNLEEELDKCMKMDQIK
ncbi:MAG: hypothetical protein IPK62_05390 [Bacteroidetes bacterium]|nr:hypothetical protein [Bacteroidota bacterium]MBK8144460.1 hypothetical protein [Bacteroidota bacterium]MBP6315659.1 hypothetical protein [Chitinophagaceae bacterium]